jgi:hypothetical protein
MRMLKKRQGAEPRPGGASSRERRQPAHSYCIKNRCADWSFIAEPLHGGRLRYQYLAAGTIPWTIKGMTDDEGRESILFERRPGDLEIS